MSFSHVFRRVPGKNSIFGLKMRMLVHSPVQKVFRSGIDPTGTYPVFFLCGGRGFFLGKDRSLGTRRAAPYITMHIVKQ